eukprot:Protomagalhaensia_sp_Gyna_25__599@NODE_1283_length_1983_cov_9_567387_g1024_i0_p2_GENE_NODE_1283_length_1983_cov_9_567387_g1024_i0NODE_1283_length_1983_cov_9_567387_g1024_i0_p2_ORF_typecomplete_len277_score41_78FAD_binding_3/PF01494_19/6_4e06_NODE_1283_length_1983_cov_9_567387_g1024_i010281858
MNLGMQDAFNLGPKLLLCLQHSALINRARLLESYEHERRPVAKSIVDHTYKVTGFALKAEQNPPCLRPLAQCLFWNVGVYCLRLLGSRVHSRSIWLRLSQLSFDYSKSFACTENWRGGRNSAGVKAGVSFPFVDVMSTDEDSLKSEGDETPTTDDGTTRSLSIRLCSLFISTGFTLIFIPPSDQVSTTAWDDFWSKKATLKFNPLISRAICIASQNASGHCDIWVRDVNAVATLNPCAGSRSESCVYVIRPDGFIGHRSKPFSIAALASYFRTFST